MTQLVLSLTVMILSGLLLDLERPNAVLHLNSPLETLLYSTFPPLSHA